MAIGIVFFGAVFVTALALGAVTRRPFPTACVVLASVVALFVAESDNMFAAFAAFALISLAGLVIDSVRETVGILLGR
jgi:hypothetical protein